METLLTSCWRPVAKRGIVGLDVVGATVAFEPESNSCSKRYAATTLSTRLWIYQPPHSLTQSMSTYSSVSWARLTVELTPISDGSVSSCFELRALADFLFGAELKLLILEKSSK